MAKKKKNKKVIRYRRPLNINVGMIIFALIFAYMAFYVYTYVRREKIEFYEVPEGSIVNDQRHTGIAFRTETVKYTEQAGNINFYLREGKKAAVGTRVYSVDETGKLSELLAEKTDGSVALSRDNLASLKKQLSSFSQTFTENDFKTVYDTRYTLDSEVLEYVSVDALKNLDSVVEEMGVNFVQVRADQSGIVSYMVDSLEGVDPNQVTEEMFDRSGYTKNILKSGKLVGVGEPAYKLVTSSDWSLVFQMTEEDAALYNGKTYGKLDFSKYMEQFISDRFVDFEIITEEVTGLKIPKSAVTDVEFYLIPKEFLAGGGKGFLKETYTENGAGAVLVSCDIYNADDTYYYVDAGENSEFKPGDYLVKENSQDRYQIGAKAAVTGVYNINKGYTDFRKVEILTSSDEYDIVARGTDYGLSVYDHIVLDARAVRANGVVIYQ